jgi:hypothetical protein
VGLSHRRYTVENGRHKLRHSRFAVAPRDALLAVGLSVLTYLSAPGYAEAQGPTADRWLVPPMAQRCAYRVTPSDTRNPYESISTFLGNVAGNYCFKSENRRGTSKSCVNADGNIVELNGFRRTPHSGFFSWPLTVGKAWDFQYVATPLVGAPGANPITWTKHVAIVAFEKVASGGTTYDAYKIEGTYHRLDAAGYDKETAFYAPSIGKVVKYDNSTGSSFEFMGCPQ